MYEREPRGAGLEEAVGSFRTALATRPKNYAAINSIGLVLWRQGKWEEAIAVYRQAADLEPRLPHAHSNLGVILQFKGQLDDAIVAYRKAVEVAPTSSRAHSNLGTGLFAQGQLDDAITEYRQAIRLYARNTDAHSNLGVALLRKGQLDEAAASLREAIRLAPQLADIWFNLGCVLDGLGQLDEAVTALQGAICLAPGNPLYHGALGETLLKQGRFTEARAATRHGLDLSPPDDPQRKVGTRNLQQCERWLALEERLAAVQQGRANPADPAERLSLAQLCQQVRQRYATATRFYAEAFVAQPPLAENLRAGHRYNAACAAALAGTGQGSDRGGVSDAERAGFRRYALTWLRADLGAWATVGQGAPKARREMMQTLRHWLKDRDLAGLRDPQQIARLPEEERPACHALWADVAAVLGQTDGRQ
jgi:tetratricopeptide (TPR) repeat protein